MKMKSRDAGCAAVWIALTASANLSPCYWRGYLKQEFQFIAMSFPHQAMKSRQILWWNRISWQRLAEITNGWPDIPPPFRSYLGSARAQKYLQAFFCSLAWIFVTVPKCLNQVFLQQPLLAALVACCFLRGLQAVPAYAFEKPIFHLCWCLWLTCWPGVEADPNIVAHWIMSLLSYPLCALEVLWN